MTAGPVRRARRADPPVIAAGALAASAADTFSFIPRSLAPGSRLAMPPR